MSEQNKRTLRPIILKEYEDLIREEMEENNLSKREATLFIELLIKFRMEDCGLTYEEAIMSMAEGW